MAVKPWRRRNPTKRRWCTGHGDAQSPTCVLNRVNPNLTEGAMYTGCRAGELTSARRSAFDARTRTLTVSGKTGTRTIPLAPAAVELFQRLSRDQLPTAYLLVRDDS